MYAIACPPLNSIRILRIACCSVVVFTAICVDKRDVLRARMFIATVHNHVHYNIVSVLLCIMYAIDIAFSAIEFCS